MGSCIVILGAGQVGHHLLRAFSEKGHNVSIWNRTLSHAIDSAVGTNAIVLKNLSDIPFETDFCIAAFSEQAISEIGAQIPPIRGILAHTAGSVPMELLKPFAKRYGVFYPLQTFTQNRVPEYSQIPIFIESSDIEGVSQLQNLAQTVFGPCITLDSEQRSKLHLAAVFACNFANASLMAAQDIVEENGLSFDLLLPLINETLAKTMDHKPSYNQTGPAVRNNKQIIAKQLKMLNENPALAAMYEAITQYIIEKQIT